MSKRNKIIYWVATLWLSLGMTSTGIVQMLHMDDELSRMAHLGFPAYALTLLGAWKLAGVVVVLIPRFPLVKEWAYAGFFFTVTGALFAHLYIGDGPKELFPALLLLVLTSVSWYFRPADRKAASTTKPIQA